MIRALFLSALLLSFGGLAGCQTSDKSREQVQEEIEPSSISEEQQQNEENRENNRR